MLHDYSPDILRGNLSFKHEPRRFKRESANGRFGLANVSMLAGFSSWGSKQAQRDKDLL